MLRISGVSGNPLRSGTVFEKTGSDRQTGACGDQGKGSRGAVSSFPGCSSFREPQVLFLRHKLLFIRHLPIILPSFPVSLLPAPVYDIAGTVISDLVLPAFQPPIPELSFFRRRQCESIGSILFPLPDFFYPRRCSRESRQDKAFPGKRFLAPGISGRFFKNREGIWQISCKYQAGNEDYITQLSIT